MNNKNKDIVILALLVEAALIVLGGCRSDMFDQAKFKPYAASSFYPDSAAAREPVTGTVVHGDPRLDSLLYFGIQDGRPATTFPKPLTSEMLHRGQMEFNIYCSPCHGQVGDGKGMIVQRGFPAPPSYHIPRLRNASPGYFFNVITNGYGKMFSYAARVQPEDRWAIIAYIRALQLSRHASAAMLSPDDQRQLRER